MINEELIQKYKNIAKKELAVLFAEDNDNAREITMKSLTLMFKKVKAVSCGQKAIEELQKYRYDLVITDMNMPNIDGSKLIKTIRSTCKTFPIIIITAHNDFKDIYKDIPNIVVLSKPFDVEELIIAIDNFEQNNNIISDDVYDKLNEAYNEARKILDMLNKNFKGE